MLMMPAMARYDGIVGESRNDAIAVIARARRDSVDIGS